MTLLDTTPGANIYWTIGAMGSVPDEHPGRLIRLEQGTDDRGRTGLVAVVILQLTNLAGDPYLKVKRILEQFVDDRDWTVESIDGTAGHPKSVSALMKELQADRREFMSRGTSPITIGEAPAEVEATPAPAATAAKGKAAANPDNLPF
jgi:hypothetical protein